MLPGMTSSRFHTLLATASVTALVWTGTAAGAMAAPPAATAAPPVTLVGVGPPDRVALPTGGTTRDGGRTATTTAV
jgi:hypothetical protein